MLQDKSTFGTARGEKLGELNGKHIFAILSVEPTHTRTSQTNTNQLRQAYLGWVPHTPGQGNHTHPKTRKTQGQGPRRIPRSTGGRK